MARRNNGVGSQLDALRREHARFQAAQRSEQLAKAEQEALANPTVPDDIDIPAAAAAPAAASAKPAEEPAPAPAADIPAEAPVDEIPAFDEPEEVKTPKERHVEAMFVDKAPVVEEADDEEAGQEDAEEGEDDEFFDDLDEAAGETPVEA